MSNERIELNDNPMTAVTKLSEDNPGALRVCLELFKESPAIDRDAVLGGFAPLLSLDTAGLYGSNI